MRYLVQIGTGAAFTRQVAVNNIDGMQSHLLIMLVRGVTYAPLDCPVRPLSATHCCVLHATQHSARTSSHHTPLATCLGIPTAASPKRPCLVSTLQRHSPQQLHYCAFRATHNRARTAFASCHPVPCLGTPTAAALRLPSFPPSSTTPLRSPHHSAQPLH
jgi:hypothetical protein